VVLFSGLEGYIPIARGVGIGAHLSGDARISKYTDRPENTREFLETRVFVSWTTGR
jgi:hypothetical protein